MCRFFPNLETLKNNLPKYNDVSIYTEYLVEQFPTFQKNDANNSTLDSILPNIHLFIFPELDNILLNSLSSIINSIYSQKNVLYLEIYNFMDHLFNKDLYNKRLKELSKYKDIYFFLGIFACEITKINILKYAIRCLLMKTYIENDEKISSICHKMSMNIKTHRVNIIYYFQYLQEHFDFQYHSKIKLFQEFLKDNQIIC